MSLKGSWWCLEGGLNTRTCKNLKISSQKLVLSELPTLCRKFRPYTKIWTKFKTKYEIAKTIWIKSSPVRRRATCKWYCVLEQLKRVDRVKLSSRSTRTSMNRQSNWHKNLFPKFTPIKDATSPLRSSQRAGLPYNPFPHPIHHLGGLGTH